MKTKTTYSSEKDFQKLRENGFKLNVGDKIKLSFCLPGKEGLYPPVESTTCTRNLSAFCTFIYPNYLDNNSIKNLV